MDKIAKNIEKTELGCGKFLRLEKIKFIDELGRSREWEAAGRLNTPGAVMIIAHLLPSNRVLITRQFRPPTGKYVLEFPAGLIEPGEPAEECARRELAEETGYAGLLSFCSAPAYSSAGMSGEATSIAVVEVNDFDYPDGMPESHQDDGEYIEIFAVEIGKLGHFLRERTACGDGVDSKLQTFVMALGYFHA